MTPAARFLLDALAAGPLGADRLIELSKRAGHRWSAVKQASFDIGATSHVGAYGISTWKLPDTPRPLPIPAETLATMPPVGYDPTPATLLSAVDELVELCPSLPRDQATRIAARLKDAAAAIKRTRQKSATKPEPRRPAVWQPPVSTDDDAPTPSPADPF